MEMSPTEEFRPALSHPFHRIKPPPMPFATLPHFKWTGPMSSLTAGLPTEDAAASHWKFERTTFDYTPGLAFTESLVKDVVPHIEKNYRTETKYRLSIAACRCCLRTIRDARPCRRAGT